MSTASIIVTLVLTIILYEIYPVLAFIPCVILLAFYLQQAIRRITLLEQDIKQKQQPTGISAHIQESPTTSPSAIDALDNSPNTSQFEEVTVKPATVDTSPNFQPEFVAPLSQGSSKDQSLDWPSVRSLYDSPMWQRTKHYLFGGNTTVRVGILLLFLGMGFLLKYAAERSNFPIELRLAGIVIAAIIILVIGWRLRTRRSHYAFALQGGGVGILYLTVFAALRLYHVLPTSGTFIMLVVISLFSSVLAILQNSLSLAVLGTLGGFMAPILVSTGGGDPVVLFSYYLLLNTIVLAIACFKSWRELNLIGCVFTFSVMALWGYRSYEPELFFTIEPFLILFFLMYVVIALLFALKQAPNLKGYVDSAIIFGVPIVAFGLQLYFVNHYAYGVAWSAFATSVFYLVLAWGLLQRHLTSARLLIEAFLALGIVFATIAIPMALDARWTAAVWSLQGAGMVWIGVRQQRVLASLFGILVLLGSSVIFSLDVGWSTSTPAVFNTFYLGRVFISLSALFAAYWLHRASKTHDWQYFASTGLLIMGLCWWLVAGSYEIIEHASWNYIPNGLLLFISFSLAIIFYLSRRLVWEALGVITRSQLFVMYVVLLYSIVSNFFFSYLSQLAEVSPLAFGGYLAWPAAFVVHYGLLYCKDQQQKRLRPYSHAAAVWLLTFIVAWICAWAIQQLLGDYSVWSLTGWVLAPLCFVFGISRAATSLSIVRYWPMQQYQSFYLSLALLPLLFSIVVWSVAINLANDGNPWPLPYVPMINPLDLTQGFVMLVLWFWFSKACTVPMTIINQASTKYFYAILSSLIFIWLTAVLIRTLHHWAGIPFIWGNIVNSVLVQSAVSIFWTLLAFGAMIIATHYHRRSIWFAGAGLLAVVVVKLFIVDLGNTGTLARVISFVGVGMLLLLIGYFSPMPPKVSTLKNRENKS
ncbi:MAG: hypothetical protein K0Q74_250 [Gammaproteobacteria bacterium]|jgi:uncharacterized membrane protein|nr:hypothetical protein [Gammaproteobacteria bacterium]